jgi:hypothetical protein
MAKPQTIGGYTHALTDACERVLVTLLRSLGPWRDSIFLVGGLTPRYLIKARPPEVPAHAGTADVDVVVDIAMLADTDAYRTLEENLHTMGFQRAVNDRGAKQSWRWKTELDGGTMILEFLADDPELRGGKVQELPTKGGVSAVNIPNAAIVFDLHDSIEITAELLDGKGRATEKVRYANIVSFTCLKAFAFDERFEPKDAHDIVYCLEHYDGGVEAASAAFARALEGNHRDVILDALSRLARRFCDAGNPDEAYRKDGPIAVARFESGDSSEASDEQDQNQRILRQRRAADIISALVLRFLDLPEQRG